MAKWTEPRKAELARRVAAGQLSPQIATEMGLSRSSVLNAIARFGLAHAPKVYSPKRFERNGIFKRLNDATSIEDVLARVYDDLERLGKQRAKTPKPTRKTKKSGDILVELSTPDLHVGKLAWGPETGHGSYDIHIAEQVFTNAVNSMVARAESLPERVERWLFPVGNDLLQTDNALGTTTSGTQVDSDGRYIKSFRRACTLMTWAIDRLSQVAPVTTVVVPGNHDRLTAFHVGDVLAAYYRSVPEVTIDNEPTLRKYVTYGACLLGFTHGSEEKEADLPLIMAQEMSQAWKDTTHREWHIGHFHKIRERRWSAGDSFGGVRVRVLPALCAPDAWHSMRGFIGEMRAAEMYLWSREGYVGHFAHTVRAS